MCDEIYKSLDISMYKFNCINGKKAFLLIKTQYIYTNTLIFFVTFLSLIFIFQVFLALFSRNELGNMYFLVVA